MAPSSSTTLLWKSTSCSNCSTIAGGITPLLPGTALEAASFMARWIPPANSLPHQSPSRTTPWLLNYSSFLDLLKHGGLSRCTDSGLPADRHRHNVCIIARVQYNKECTRKGKRRLIIPELIPSQYPATMKPTYYWNPPNIQNGCHIRTVCKHDQHTPCPRRTYR